MSGLKISCLLILACGLFLSKVLGTPTLGIVSGVSTATGAVASNSLASGASNATNIVKNAACEMNPTHLLCNTSVRYGHKIESRLPGDLNWRHCKVLIPSPHCCRQFCAPAAGGTCDLGTGACFCQGTGVPDACGLLIDGGSASLGEMTTQDMALLETCKGLCRQNPNGCNSTAAVTDGIAGTVCVCYCTP